MVVGLQTYTIKSLLKKEQSIDAAFSEIAKLGITNIELAVDYLKFDFSVKGLDLISKYLTKYNIKVWSMQIKYSTIIKNVENTVAVLRAFDCNYITISVIDMKVFIKGVQGVQDYVRKANELVDIFAPYGITIGHHNHHMEFYKFEGKTVFDMLIESYKGEFVLDTYWIQRGGANHLELLDRLKGRVSIIHLRDYKLELKIQKFDFIGKDTYIGGGNLPFALIMKKAEECGVKYGMIEQSTKTPLESVTLSYNYLKKVF